MRILSRSLLSALAALLLSVACRPAADNPNITHISDLPVAVEAQEVGPVPPPGLTSDHWPSFAADQNERTERSESYVPTVEERLGELDQELNRHIQTFERTKNVGLWLLIPIFGLIAGVTGYCWFSFRQFRFTLKRNQLRSLNQGNDIRNARQVRHLDNGGFPRTSTTAGASCGRLTRPSDLDDSTPETCTFDYRSGEDRLPRVQIHRETLDQIIMGISASLREHPDLETGFALVGKIIGGRSSRIITICGAIPAGSRAIRRSAQVTFDREEQQQELNLLQMVDAEVMHIGDVHSHPGRMEICSAGDYQTDAANVRASQSQEMVFVIATVDSGPRSTLATGPIRQDGLKLNFYYLGKATSYDYQPVHPEVSDGEAVVVPDALRRFVLANPVRAYLDFDNLHRLTNYKLTIRELPNEHGRASCFVVLAHRKKDFRALIEIPCERDRAPEVLLETGDEMTKYSPAYLTSRFGSMIWFTQIVLELEREFCARRRVAGSGQHASAGKRSVFAGNTLRGPRKREDHE